jgi:hypothetical protein
VDVGLLRVMPRPAHPARASQVLEQLLLQGTTRLDEEAAVDGSRVTRDGSRRADKYA